MSKLILQADHIPHAELFVSPVESHLLWFSSYNPVFEEKIRAFLQASWTGAGAGVKSLQIPCMMQGYVLAAEVKQDGMVGSSAFVVLNSREKAARSGLARPRTPRSLCEGNFLGETSLIAVLYWILGGLI